MEKFSLIFKELVRENEENIKVFADKIKISDSLLYKYEKDTAQPSLKNLVKIANYFNCSINFLVGIDDLPNTIKIKMNTDNKMFYKRYTKLLLNANKTHYEVCKELDISQSTKFQWKNGSLPRLETLIKFALYFGVSVDYLVGRTDEQ